MKTKNLPVDPCIQHERLDLCEEAVQKVRPQSLALPLVELPPAVQILRCRIQDAQLHPARLRNSALASSQSRTPSEPERTRSSVSLRASPCQAGDSIASSSRAKSSQSECITFSFSSRGIRCISIVIMPKQYAI